MNKLLISSKLPINSKFKCVFCKKLITVKDDADIIKCPKCKEYNDNDTSEESREFFKYLTEDDRKQNTEVTK